MNYEEVEVFEAPVRELLAEDGLNLVFLVEGVPQLGDDEDIFALDETVLDGTGYTLAGLLLVAVIYKLESVGIPCNC